MPRNCGRTTLKRTKRNTDPMRDYDRLPAELRKWVSDAVLPWRAGSVQRAYDNALARTGDANRALQELDDLQRALIAKDAQRVWGQSHPNAMSSKPV